MTTTTTLRRLLYGVLLATLLYVGFALYVDGRELLDHLTGVSLVALGAALLLSLFNYGLRFLRWQIYLRDLELTVPTGKSLLIFLSGFVMSLSPGKVGEVIKSALLLRSCAIPVARTAPIVVAERLTDVLGLLLLATLGALAIPGGLALSALFGAGLVLCLSVFSSRRVLDFTVSTLSRLPLLRRLAAPLREAQAATGSLLRLPSLLRMSLLSAVSWGAEALALLLLLGSITAHSPAVLPTVFVYAASTLAGALSILPGGLGVTEAGLTGLLLWLDLAQDLPRATATAYAIRFTTLWFGVIVGFFAFLLYERQEFTPKNHSAGESDGP